MRSVVLGKRLVAGWALTLASFALLSQFPRMETAQYDRQMLFYRNLTNLVPAMKNGYDGLHRSITLMGDYSGNENMERAALVALRENQAAASVWVSSQDEHLPSGLKNEPLELSPIYAVPTETRWNGKRGDAPPFVLKQSPSDGVVREVYLALKTPNGLLPCLPLVLYARFLNEIDATPEIRGDMLWLANHYIPVNQDEQGYSMSYLPYPSQIRATLVTSESESTTDSMEPISLKDALAMPDAYFGKRVPNRFYFMGDYSMAAMGEQVTPLGPYRNFQIAAMALDTLIQGPYLRWISGVPGFFYYLIVSSLLSIWLLAPTSGLGRCVRLVQCLLAWKILSLGAFVAGYYFPTTWILIYLALLNLWILAKIWWTTLTYLRRYGGEAAAHMLATGQVNLDHSVAEERTASIVFVGLPAHLRDQELNDDPLTLQHRQIFSKRVADITQRQDGIVHDFQADYLMLGFGTHPGRQHSDHAVRAFRAANELIACQEYFQEVWSCSPAGSRVQVSLNTGMVAVGWVGTSRLKRASAAIGDTTNVTARLLGTAKKYDLNLILSESSHQLLQDQATFEPLPPVMLKGKSEAVAIYKLVIPE